MLKLSKVFEALSRPDPREELASLSDYDLKNALNNGINEMRRRGWDVHTFGSDTDSLRATKKLEL